jgi:hypothetical protein
MCRETFSILTLTEITRSDLGPGLSVDSLFSTTRLLLRTRSPCPTFLHELSRPPGVRPCSKDGPEGGKILAI